MEMDVDDTGAAPERPAPVTPGSVLEVASPWAASSCASTPWSPVTPAVHNRSSVAATFGVVKTPVRVVVSPAPVSYVGTSTTGPTTVAQSPIRTGVIRMAVGSPCAAGSPPRRQPVTIRRVSFGHAPTSPGAVIRQYAASQGIPLSLRNSPQEVPAPVPVRSSQGEVVAPSPTARGGGGYGPLTFGNLAQPADSAPLRPPAILRTIVTPCSTRFARAGAAGG